MGRGAGMAVNTGVAAFLVPTYSFTVLCVSLYGCCELRIQQMFTSSEEPHYLGEMGVHGRMEGPVGLRYVSDKVLWDVQRMY